LPVSVFGRNWIERAKVNPVLSGRAHDALGDEAYVATLQRAKIGLCFVSHWNYNQTAGRSYEIPACGTFLLAMRTAGHLEHYREGEEAEFFDCETELVAKARRYLTDEPARKRIADAGHRRCVDSGYSWREIMRRDWAAIRPRITARLSSR
jgi:spore maturation protein CgeB